MIDEGLQLSRPCPTHAIVGSPPAIASACHSSRTIVASSQKNNATVDIKECAGEKDPGEKTRRTAALACAACLFSDHPPDVGRVRLFAAPEFLRDPQRHGKDRTPVSALRIGR